MGKGAVILGGMPKVVGATLEQLIEHYQDKNIIIYQTGHVSGTYLTTAAVSNHMHGYILGYNITATSASTGLTLSVAPPQAVLNSLFAGDAITLSTLGVNTTVSVQSSLFQLAGSAVGFGYTSQSISGSDINMTVDTFGVSMDIPVYLTTAALSDHDHGMSPAITGQLGITSNSSAWSISIPDFLLTAALSNHTHSDLYIPLTASTAYQTSVLSTKFLTTAANSTHTHGSFLGTNITQVSSGSNGLALSVGNYITTGMQSDLTSVFQYTSNTSNITNNAINTNQSSLFTGGNDISISSNITSSGATGYALISSGTAMFVGSNNITILQDGNRIAFIGAAAGTGGAGTGFTTGSTAGIDIAGTLGAGGLSMGIPKYITTAPNLGIGGIGNTASSNAFTTGSVIFSAVTNITVNTSADGASQYIKLSVADPAVAANSVYAGDYISLSINGISTTVSATNLQATSNTSNITSNAFPTANTSNLITGIAGSNASTASKGLVQFVNSNGLTFGLSGNTITASYASDAYIGSVYSNYYQATSNSSLSIAVSDSGKFQLTSDNSKSLGTGYTTHTHSDLYLNTSVSSAWNSTVLSATFAVTSHTHSNLYAPLSGTTYYQTSNLSNTFMQNSESGNIYFANSNGVSFGSTNSSNSTTITASINPVTGAIAGIILNTNGNTSGATASVTSGTMVWAGGSNITLSQNANSVTIIGGGGSGGFVVSMSSNTTGTYSQISTGTMVLIASNNITLSQNGNSLAILGAAAGTAGAAIKGTGTYSQNTGTIVFQSSNGLTFGLATNGVMTGSYTVPTGNISFKDTNGVSWGTVTSVSTDQTVVTASISPSGSGVGSSTTVNTTAGTDFKLTVNATGINISIPAYITTAMLSNMTSVLMYTSGQGSVYYIDSNGISWGASTSGLSTSITASISAVGGGGAAIKGSGTYTQNSGTIEFANSNSITFGLTNNQMTASFSQSTHSHPYLVSDAGSNFVGLQTSAVTGASATINSSGIQLNIPQGSLYFNDSNGIIFGGSSNGLSTTITGSLGQIWQIYSNTSGTSSSSYGSALKLNAGSNITLSGGSDGITIIGASGGTATGGGGGVAINASGSIYSSGTVVLTGSSNITVSYSSDTIRLSVADAIPLGNSTAYQTTNLSQTFMNTSVSGSFQQTSANSKFASKWSLAGAQTVGTSTQLISDILYLSGGNMITLSGNASTIIVSMNSASLLGTGAAASFQYTTDNSNSINGWSLAGAQTAGTTTSNSINSLYLSAGNMMTLSGNSNTVIFSVNTASLVGTGALASLQYTSANTKFASKWSLAGANTAGTTTQGISDILYLSGDNFMTLSADGSTIKFSVNSASLVGTGALASLQYTSANTKFVSKWSLVGNNTSGTTTQNISDNIIYFSGGNDITLSGNASTIVISANDLAASGSNGSFTFQTLTFGTKNGLTFYTDASGIQASYTVPSGSLAFSDAGGVTWSSSVGTGASTASSTVYVGSMLGGGVALYASNSTYSSGTAQLSGSTNLTVSYNASTILLSVADAIPLGNSTKFASKWSIVGNNSAGSTTYGVSDNILYLSATNITLSGNNNTLIISGPSLATTIGAIGVSASGGNAANVTALSFQNSNNITFGYNASTITASYSNTNLTGIADSAATVGAGIVQFSNANGVSFGLAGSTMTASVVDGWVRDFEPYAQTNTSAWVPGIGSWYFVPFCAPGAMAGGRINFLVNNTSTAGMFMDITTGYYSSQTGGFNQSFSYQLSAALYSRQTGANSTRLASFWGNTFSFGYVKLMTISQSGANSSVSASMIHSLSYVSDIGSNGSVTLNNVALSGSFSGTGVSDASNKMSATAASLRNMFSNAVMYPIGLNTTITEGNYWLGIMYSTTHNTATINTSYPAASALVFSQLNMVGIQRAALAGYRIFGQTTTNVTEAPFYGAGVVYSAASASAPVSLLSNDFRTIGNGIIPYFNIQYRGLTNT